MKPTKTSYWVWLLIVVGFFAGCLLVFFADPESLVSVSIYVYLFMFWSQSLLAWFFLLKNRKRIPESECAACGYLLKGLSEPVCPECGADPRTHRHSRFAVRGRRRVIELACVMFVLGTVLLIGSYQFGQRVWEGISYVADWPTEFVRGVRYFPYSVAEEGTESGSYRSGEQLYLTVSYNSYPNRDWSEPIVASVAAKFLPQSQQPAWGDPIVDPTWRGQVSVELIDASETGFFKALSALDTDGLFDAVSEEYLARKGSLEPTLAMTLSDPVKRRELKESLAQAWEVNRSTEWRRPGDGDQLLGKAQFSFGSAWFNLRGSRSSGGEYSELLPVAKVGMWVTSGIGWLLSAAALAAYLRWYDSRWPKSQELVPARLRAIWRYFLRSCGDAAKTALGGALSDHPTCRVCGHPATGLARASCPECGCSLASGVVKPGAMHPNKRRVSGAVLLAASMLGGFVSLGATMGGESIAVLALLIFGVLFCVALRLLLVDRSIEPFIPSESEHRNSEKA